MTILDATGIGILLGFLVAIYREWRRESKHDETQGRSIAEQKRMLAEGDRWLAKRDGRLKKLGEIERSWRRE